MSKKDNKRRVVRSTRRTLNRVLDFTAKISGKRLHTQGYGSGVSRSDIRDRTVDDGEE